MGTKKRTPAPNIVANEPPPPPATLAYALADPRTALPLIDAETRSFRVWALVIPVCILPMLAGRTIGDGYISLPVSNPAKELEAHNRRELEQLATMRHVLKSGV